MKEVLILSSVLFLHLLRRTYRVFIFHSVNMVYRTSQSVYVEPSLLPMDRFHLIIVCDSFNMLFNSVWQNFVEDFCSLVNQGYWTLISFSYSVFVWVWYQNNAGLKTYFGSIPSSSNFWKSLKRTGINSSNILQNSPLKPSGSWLSVVGRFLITNLISMVIIGLFIFSISSWFGLSSCISLHNCYHFF